MVVCAHCPLTNYLGKMRNRIRNSLQLAVMVFLAAACGQDSKNAVGVTAPDSPRFLFDEDWMNGNCYGGTCQPVLSSGGYSSLYGQIQAEANRLNGLSSKPLCQNLGSGMQTMLNRGQYFVRLEGPANVNGGTRAGEYDPLDGTWTTNPPGATNNARNGSIWFARGTFRVVEDGHYNDTMDTIRHETAHTLLDLTVDPSGNTLFFDAGNGSTMTAQQISMFCK